MGSGSLTIVSPVHFRLGGNQSVDDGQESRNADTRLDLFLTAVAVAGDATKDVSVEQGEQVSPQTRHMAVLIASKADTEAILVVGSSRKPRKNGVTAFIRSTRSWSRSRARRRRELEQ